MLLSRRLGAHVFTLACQFAWTFLRLLQHVAWIQSLQFLIDRQSHLTCEVSRFDDVDILEGVILIEDCHSPYCSVQLEGLTYILQLLFWQNWEFWWRNWPQESHLIVKNPSLLRIDHFENVVLVETDKECVLQSNSVVHPRAWLFWRL